MVRDKLNILLKDIWKHVIIGSRPVLKTGARQRVGGSSPPARNYFIKSVKYQLVETSYEW